MAVALFIADDARFTLSGIRSLSFFGSHRPGKGPIQTNTRRETVFRGTPVLCTSARVVFVRMICVRLVDWLLSLVDC
jgi:hypothetical protein